MHGKTMTYWIQQKIKINQKLLTLTEKRLGLYSSSNEMENRELKGKR